MPKPKSLLTTFKFKDEEQREQMERALETTGQTRDFVLQKKIDEYIVENGGPYELKRAKSS